MQYDNSEWAVVCSTVAPIKQKPEINSVMIDEALFGMVVNIVRHEPNDWYYIQTHYNYSGYMHASNLLIDSQEALKWKDRINSFITGSTADIMAEPRYASYPIAFLTRGAMVHTGENEEGPWKEVLLPQNQKGWIRKSCLKSFSELPLKENEDSLRRSLVNTALSYCGTQYRWGGKSPLGIDCSGLCSMAYMLNGIIIYRDAELKEQYMTRISTDSINPGDLLFFPGHVAMYIGDGRYVHSTGKEGGVVINSLNPSHDDYREDLEKSITGVGTIFGK